ncbi:hypothetical protein KIPB_002300, partial [Kipferlia bialata]|eukprot:g2300.t1
MDPPERITVTTGVATLMHTWDIANIYSVWDHPILIINPFLGPTSKDDHLEAISKMRISQSAYAMVYICQDKEAGLYDYAPISGDGLGPQSFNQATGTLQASNGGIAGFYLDESGSGMPQLHNGWGGYSVVPDHEDWLEVLCHGSTDTSSTSTEALERKYSIDTLVDLGYEGIMLQVDVGSAYGENGYLAENVYNAVSYLRDQYPDLLIGLNIDTSMTYVGYPFQYTWSPLTLPLDLFLIEGVHFTASRGDYYFVDNALASTYHNSYLAAVLQRGSVPRVKVTETEEDGETTRTVEHFYPLVVVRDFVPCSITSNGEEIPIIEQFPSVFEDALSVLASHPIVYELLDDEDTDNVACDVVDIDDYASSMGIDIVYTPVFLPAALEPLRDTERPTDTLEAEGAETRDIGAFDWQKGAGERSEDTETVVDDHSGALSLIGGVRTVDGSLSTDQEAEYETESSDDRCITVSFNTAHNARDRTAYNVYMTLLDPSAPALTEERHLSKTKFDTSESFSLLDDGLVSGSVIPAADDTEASIYRILAPDVIPVAVPRSEALVSSHPNYRADSLPLAYSVCFHNDIDLDGLSLHVSVRAESAAGYSSDGIGRVGPSFGNEEQNTAIRSLFFQDSAASETLFYAQTLLTDPDDEISPFMSSTLYMEGTDPTVDLVLHANPLGEAQGETMRLFFQPNESTRGGLDDRGATAMLIVAMPALVDGDGLYLCTDLTGTAVQWYTAENPYDEAIWGDNTESTQWVASATSTEEADIQCSRDGVLYTRLTIPVPSDIPLYSHSGVVSSHITIGSSATPDRYPDNEVATVGYATAVPASLSPPAPSVSLSAGEGVEVLVRGVIYGTSVGSGGGRAVDSLTCGVYLEHIGSVNEASTSICYAAVASTVDSDTDTCGSEGAYFLVLSDLDVTHTTGTDGGTATDTYSHDMTDRIYVKDSTTGLSSFVPVPDATGSCAYTVTGEAEGGEFPLSSPSFTGVTDAQFSLGSGVQVQFPQASARGSPSLLEYVLTVLTDGEDDVTLAIPASAVNVDTDNVFTYNYTREISTPTAMSFGVSVTDGVTAVGSDVTLNATLESGYTLDGTGASMPSDTLMTRLAGVNYDSDIHTVYTYVESIEVAYDDIGLYIHTSTGLTPSSEWETWLWSHSLYLDLLGDETDRGLLVSGSNMLCQYVVSDGSLLKLPEKITGTTTDYSDMEVVGTVQYAVDADTHDVEVVIPLAMLQERYRLPNKYIKVACLIESDGDQFLFPSVDTGGLSFPIASNFDDYSSQLIADGDSAKWAGWNVETNVDS